MGKADQLQHMERVSTLFSIVDLVATSVAEPDWHLYRRQSPEQPAREREIVTDHPAARVWAHPNNHYTQDEFIEAIQQHYELTGEFWWVLEDQGGMISGVWPIRPDRMAPVASRSEFISGYRYTIGGETVPLTREQVVYERRMNPFDPWRGLSPVASLVIDVDADRAASIWNAVFFKNGAEPGGVLQLKRKEIMDDHEWARWVEHWKQSHQGASNAHTVAVMEMGEFIPSQYTQRDMQFVQLRDFSEKRVKQAYRISKAMLGEVDDVNRANNEAQLNMFARSIVRPRLKRLRRALNEKFLPRFRVANTINGVTRGGTLEFDFVDPTEADVEAARADQTANVTAAMALVGAGADWDQTLAAFKLPAVPRNATLEPSTSG
jgi:HK97 family phage portal protein